MHSILDAVQKIGAKRLVIDSLAGFEMALSPGFRADFRGSLYRMIFALTGIGVTIVSTVEVDESFTEFPFSTYSISFLTDDIIRLRYVSIDGQLRKIMVVIKMRGGNHAKDIREYEITSKGVVILGQRLTAYQGLISGIPVHSVDRTQRKRRYRSQESGMKGETSNQLLSSNALDDIDGGILGELKKNARIPFAEFGCRVRTSTPPISSASVEGALLQSGLPAVVDAARVGLPLCAFVKVTVPNLSCFLGR